MKNLERRIERLEDKLSPKYGPRLIYIYPHPDEEEEETPYQIQVSSELWAHAMRGGPFTEEEIRRLKEKHRGEKVEKEPESKKEIVYEQS